MVAILTSFGDFLDNLTGVPGSIGVSISIRTFESVMVSPISPLASRLSPLASRLSYLVSRLVSLVSDCDCDCDCDSRYMDALLHAQTVFRDHCGYCTRLHIYQRFHGG
jgi:hypothetical protein